MFQGNGTLIVSPEPGQPRPSSSSHAQNGSASRWGGLLLFGLQIAIFAGALGVTMLARHVAHVPSLMAFVCGVIYFFVVWCGYLLLQRAYPNWWAPWDDGLPREQRMLNAFVPAAVVFVLACIFIFVLSPVYKKARQLNREKDMQRHQALSKEVRQAEPTK
jgi:hypothetical protein